MGPLFSMRGIMWEGYPQKNCYNFSYTPKKYFKSWQNFHPIKFRFLTNFKLPPSLTLLAQVVSLVIYKSQQLAKFYKRDGITAVDWHNKRKISAKYLQNEFTMIEEKLYHVLSPTAAFNDNQKELGHFPKYGQKKLALFWTSKLDVRNMARRGRGDMPT